MSEEQGTPAGIPPAVAASLPSTMPTSIPDLPPVVTSFVVEADLTSQLTAPVVESVSVAPAPVAQVTDFADDEPDDHQIEGIPLQHALRQNFTLDTPYTTTGMPGFDRSKETIAMPAASADNIVQALADAGQALKKHDENDEESEYVTLAGLGMGNTPMDGGMEGAALRETAEYVQKVEFEGHKFAGMSPKPKARATHTSDSARHMIRSELKLGTAFHLPLWHSGFWITLQAPDESALLDLNRRISAEKVAIGRQTYGLTFSNTMVYTSRHLVDFVLEHTLECSLAVGNVEELRNHIRMQDLPLLVWALACAVYPTGFQYRRPCMVDPDKCKHVVEEKVNLSRLMWTDKSQLSTKQLAHMTKRGRNDMSVEQVKAYVDDFVIGKNRKVQLTESLSMELRVPSIEDHLQSGFKWINMIEETYGKAMTYDEAARQDFLAAQAKASIMREFGHVVANVQVHEHIFTDPQIIENTLNDLTARDDVREKFEFEVRKFLEDAVVSLIAIPTYKCPNCGEDQTVTNKESPYPELIPLDVVMVFFSLVYQRMMRIRERDLKALVR